MRIVGGEFRRPAARRRRARDAIRPSADRLRQTLFDILAHGYGDAVSGARVLDLFAGTGALGLEALSRGAAFALFVEEGVEARGLIRRNVEALGLTGRTRIFRRDATRLGPAGHGRAVRSGLRRPALWRRVSANWRSPRRVAGGWLDAGRALRPRGGRAGAKSAPIAGLRSRWRPRHRQVTQSCIFLRGVIRRALDRS